MIKRIALFLTLTLMASLSWADKTVYLTSLDWPPYSGKSLPDQGGSIAVAKAAFEAMGYSLVVDVFPWSRAVALAKDANSKYAGYVPEYYSDGVAEEFIYSDPMGKSPVGFIEQAGKPISWSSHEDLKNFSIGVVQDYVNEAKFDGMVADGSLKVEPVISDKNNIMKVINGRLDMAVIDKNVMNYLFANDKALQGKASKANFNSKLLDDKDLYICFKRTPQGEELVKIFNEGLKKIDVNSILASHM
ncbi:ABC transporter [Bacterioplanes sanyensis]|uniref:ABC transporter n=1 Tax=Bacterioplanes sanyensis TaxID=1249553 RepID=A0A222FEF5_9GAMM|nr:ABC transporter substrate-binding protein [Bacterioplanes sanyensis]ASP37398.1 ABC transporter [Bacterioplanes sanyensis]